MIFDIPSRLRLGALLRATFIILLAVVTLRVSMPQNETIWTAYDTPGDLVRLSLGLAVCAWLLIQLVKLPKDVTSYRTWQYLGLVLIPFGLVCLFLIW
jgi:TRAP-type C4-dicarboxylate transport system permease small subunit